ncbi:redoxin domain-containing protein, partial [candidate division WOR-3 bacterium]|nr:redoxin domain-containing protein [candidate division WOR-3 bacterium]MBD3365294.1 redoxin domain-containing protein [candidate division WOR-3 bacterium]
IRYRADEISKDFWVLKEPDSVYRYMNLIETCCNLLDKSWSKARLLYDKACFETWQGNNPKALVLLEQAAEHGFCNYAYIETNSDLASLLEKSQLKGLIESMKEKTKEYALSDPIYEPAPDFTLVSTDGDTVILSELKGNIVILGFWSACCGSVGAYTMMIVEQYLNEHPSEFNFFGIGKGIDNPRAVNKLFRQTWKVKAPILVGSQDVFDEFGIEGTPHILLLDKEGNIVYSSIGYDKNKAGFYKKHTRQT